MNDRRTNWRAPGVFARREIRRLYRPDNVVQWLIHDDPNGGRRAFEKSWGLARLAVECLADLGVLKPTDSPPDVCDQCFVESLKYHYFAQWTWFVYQLAKTPLPGSHLRSYEAPFIEHNPLKDGAVCWTLSVPIFEASALAIERVLSDFQSDPAAGPADPSTDPSTPPGTQRATKGTTNTGERRRGQALSEQEKKIYKRIIKTAKRLNLPNRTAGNTAKIANAAKVDTSIVTKALKWGHKHHQY